MQRRSGGRALGAVLFTDIVGSTVIAAEMGNTRWGELVARHHRLVRRLIARYDGHEVDTAGDGFFVTFERPADAIRCGVGATDAVRELGIEIRAGVSFGELEEVGRKAGGLVVNTAARVMSVAGPGEVLVPSSVKEIVPGSGIAFEEHGVHQLKGLEGEFRLYKVTDVDGRAPAPPLEAEEAAERRREIFPTGRRRGPLIAGLAAGAVAVTVAAWILLTGDAPPPPRDPGPVPLRHAVASLDAETGSIGSPVPLHGPPGRASFFNFIDHPMAVGEGGVWVLRPPLLLHVDPRHDEVRGSIEVGIGASQTVVTGAGAVWALTDRTVYRLNPATDQRETVLVAPATFGITTYSLALSDALWVGISGGTLVRLDPVTGARDQADTGSSIDGVAATRDAVWIVDVLAGEVTAIDPRSIRPIGDPIAVRGSLDQIVAHGSGVWILDRQVGIVTRIDAISMEVTGTARVGDHPTDMGESAEAIWVGDESGTLFAVDPTTLRVERFDVGAEVLGVDVDEAEGLVWLYAGDAIDEA